MPTFVDFCVKQKSLTMSKQFSEATRVQIPAILHLMRLGYAYLPTIDHYDRKTNILTDVFKRKVKDLNPNASEKDIDLLLDTLARIADNDDLGREFYKVINSTSGLRVIDFDNPNNNDWHCAAEFTCKNEDSGDNFRPDITCFVNGLPLAFIEVKIPNNKDGILAERNRMNQRMGNKKFRRFLNVTQLMVFSNNQEYDTENRVPLQGAFYASISKGTMFFNVFSVIWILFVFRPFIDMVCGWVGYDVNMQKEVVGAKAFLANSAKLSFVLAAFHTSFNVVNTFILIWFIPQIERFVCWVIKPKKVDEEEDFRLHFITAGFMKTPELSVLEAQKEIQQFSHRMQRMFGMVRELLNLSSSSSNKKDNKAGEFNKLYSRIEKYEGISDNMELEIANYLNSVSDAHLSDDTKAKIRAMLREVSELESIGDACFNMARTISRKYNGKEDHFIEKQYTHLHQMMELTDQSLSQMNRLMGGRKEAYDVNRTFNIEHEINNYRNQLKTQNITDINNREYTYAVGTIYMDLINECEKLGDYVVNVVEARMGIR